MCQERKQLTDAFMAAYQRLNEVLSSQIDAFQTRGVLHLDEELDAAERQWRTAKETLLAHIHSHGCLAVPAGR